MSRHAAHGTPNALTGLRILDCADESGAYCAKLLADMGADVIKVEAPDGDPTRDIGPFYAGRTDREHSLFFWHYHTNQRSFALDRDDGVARVQLDALLAAADVAITTGTPATLRRRGLDYPTLAARHPRLIVAAITGFGLSGPYCEWKSCDTVAQALGGMAFVNGHPGEPPLRALGAQAYHAASMYAAIGVLLALLVRRRDGHGQQVDVSLQECVTATVEHASGVFHQTGAIAERRGTLHWSRSFRVARCRDGYALHGTLGDWTSLVEWVKADGKAQDLVEPSWADVGHRQRECEHLFDVLDAWAREYAVADLVDGAQLRRLPYAAVLPLAAVPTHPQLRARGFFVPVLHPELDRPLTYPGPPYAFSATPWLVRRRAPAIGEDTAAILAEISRTPSHLDGTPEASPPAPRPCTGSRAPRALAGVRVLDFTWVVAGPVATRVLADHGADVIKIERRDTLDMGSRRGGLTGNLNRGKRSMVVNMSDPRGVALVRDLLRQCDVVIDNFSARVMPNWGLDYGALRALKPNLIAVSMSGFGHTGPHKDDVSYGPTLQALSGYTAAMRHAGGAPAGWGFSYADMVSGYSAALAVLIALWHRARTGEGQCIDLAQFEAVTAAIGPTLLDVLANGATPEALGNRSPERPAAPHGIYRCQDQPGGGPARDRWCAICVFTDDEWTRFVGAIGAPAWAQAPHFATLTQRLTQQDELDRLVESWTSRHPAEVVMAILQNAGVAAGIVANAEDLCRRDPHLQARRYWATLDTPEGVLTFDGVPARLSRTPGFVAAPGPLLGEHTAPILRDLLGLEPGAIDRLREEHVVA